MFRREEKYFIVLLSYERAENKGSTSRLSDIISYERWLCTDCVIRELVRMKCMRKHIVRARGDVVATKLDIILSFFFHAHTSKSEGGQRTGAKRRDIALRFGFLVGSGRRSPCAMGK